MEELGDDDNRFEFVVVEFAEDLDLGNEYQ